MAMIVDIDLEEPLSIQGWPFHAVGVVYSNICQAVALKIPSNLLNRSDYKATHRVIIADPGLNCDAGRYSIPAVKERLGVTCVGEKGELVKRRSS